MSALDTLERLGIRVLECADLGIESVWVAPYRLLIFDADLSAIDAEDVARQVLISVQQKAPPLEGWHRYQLEALCCECGQTRRVSRKRVRLSVPIGDTAAGVTKPYRCNHCTRMTMHAIVGDGGSA